jgi:hypothetical protein
MTGGKGVFVEVRGEVHEIIDGIEVRYGHLVCREGS